MTDPRIAVLSALSSPGWHPVPEAHGMPWDEAEQLLAAYDASRAAAPSAPADRAALSDTERQFLTFALDQAAEEMSLGDGFTDEDRAALEKLRRVAGEAQQPETQADCPRCPDGHTPPTRGSQPWSAWVDSARDGDGQPMQITVARSAGAHVAESDAQWVRERLNTPAEPSAYGLPLDHPLRRQCRCSEAGVCRTCSERPSAVSQPGKEATQ
jgi:hypothetical protein